MLLCYVRLYLNHRKTTFARNPIQKYLHFHPVCACIKYAKSFSIFVCQNIIINFHLRRTTFIAPYISTKQNLTEVSKSKKKKIQKTHTKSEAKYGNKNVQRIGARIKWCRYRIIKVFFYGT